MYEVYKDPILLTSMLTFSDDLKSITKKGCLNVTDVHSSVGECREKGDTIGLETYRSYMCICNDRNRCNSASHSQQSASFILLTVLPSLLFYINAADLIGS
ncbi:hypothetical protein WR25_15298 [Diploscapter pachys]|uniref:Uncharacterized protein n=1 Tax=Diploscapter pachys TaxID=2018661 RepID=A0A2A2KFX1_9BILA|nr:hypothetical protein WR25_15298 [Diploscapter pachys]